MIFIMGISSKEVKLEFNQTILCSHCKGYGRLEVYLFYSYLSLFFIPTFKWGKKYYVKSTCCNKLYTIEKSLGIKIQKGEQIILSEEELQPIHSSGNDTFYNQCPHCGYDADKDFVYCPKCGNPLII